MTVIQQPSAKLRHFVVALCLIALYSIQGNAADPARRDGNWWQTQDRGSKLEYAVGIFDGMDLGHNFSTWKYFGSKNADDQKVVEKASSAYSEYSQKYFSNVTNDQLVDGVDAFYKDYRNRRIKIMGAVWLVVNSIAGTPAKELENMIESWRQNAE